MIKSSAQLQVENERLKRETEKAQAGFALSVSFFTFSLGFIVIISLSMILYGLRVNGSGFGTIVTEKISNHVLGFIEAYPASVVLLILVCLVSLTFMFSMKLLEMSNLNQIYANTIVSGLELNEFIRLRDSGFLVQSSVLYLEKMKEVGRELPTKAEFYHMIELKLNSIWENATGSKPKKGTVLCWRDMLPFA